MRTFDVIDQEYNKSKNLNDIKTETAKANNKRDTPLHHACQIVCNGVRSNIMDKIAHTYVNLGGEARFKLNKKGNMDRTPVMVAAEHGSWELFGGDSPFNKMHTAFEQSKGLI